jgi:predicted phosphodiesterase
MRLAVITDIHGNALALEAALADIARRGIADIICLGDIASGMGWPAETIALLQRHGIPCIRGNHDRQVGEAPAERQRGQDAIAFNGTTPEQRAWLRDLPRHLHLAGGILACHGSPDSDTQNLLEEARGGLFVPSPLADIRARLGEAGLAAKVVLCGHSHRYEVMQVPGGPLVVNPGSLGLPGFRVGKGEDVTRSESRAPHARYAVLHLQEDASPEAELLAIRYDWNAAADRAEHLGSAVWAHMIRTGFLPEST